ncbi:MAG: thioredoxin family protein [Deltaproteobacteria bacterium]
MKIEVLGAVAGCANCKKLLEQTIKAVEELALPAKVDYVSGTERMLQLGIMQSPALVVNGRVVASGFIPSVGKIKTLLEGLKDDASVLPSSPDSSCKCGGNC